MWFQTGPNLWSIASLFFTSLCGTLQLKGTKFHHPATVPFRPPAGFFRGCRVGFWVWYIRYIHSCFNLCSAGFGMFRMYSQKKTHLRVSPTVGSMRRWWVFCLDGLAQQNTLRDSDDCLDYAAYHKISLYHVARRRSIFSCAKSARFLSYVTCMVCVAGAGESAF